MKKAWMQRAIGAALVATAVGIIPFLNEKVELERPVTITVPFERGIGLDQDTETLIAQAFKESVSRPEASIVVSGHSGSRGDTQANINLSKQRAEAIEQRLADQGLNLDRIEVVGLGGSELLPRKENESERAYQRRLARVDILIAP